MARRGLLLAYLAVTFGLGSSACFMEPINDRPKVMIANKTAQVSLGSDLLFEASVRDDDTLTYAWYRRAGATCPASIDEAELATGAQTIATCVNVYTCPVKVDTREPFCVWVVVRDPHGARAFAPYLVTPTNRAPQLPAVTVKANGVAVMPFATQVAQAHPLYSSFDVAASPVDPDGDTTTLAWTVRLGATDVTAAACDDKAPSKACLCGPKGTPDRTLCLAPGDFAGDIVVTVAASDPTGMKTEAQTINLRTTDMAPCLANLSPAVFFARRSLATETIFSATVSDDGDPFPPVPGRDTNQVKFTWSYSYDGMTFTPTAETRATYGFRPSGSLRVFDRLWVRLDVADRARAAAEGCLADGSRCEARAGCAQRVTWVVEFEP